MFGGKSFEHDISIVSAYQLKKKVDEFYEVHLIYVDMNNELFIADKMKLDDFKKERLNKLKKTRFRCGGVKGIDVDVIVGLMHGENGEDGILASLCRFYGVCYLGCGVFSGSLCIDKGFSYKYLSNNGIKMVESIIYSYEDFLDGVSVEFMPCIIKPCRLGSSIGIRVCRDNAELNEGLIEGFKYDEKLVIQPFFEDLVEYNLAVSMSRVSNLECIKKRGDFFSFESKYCDSFKHIHQQIVDFDRYEEFKKIGREVYDLIDASGIIRIDFFVINDEIYVNEVNTTPGALAMYLFEDFISVFDECLRLACVNKGYTINRRRFLAKSDINK